MQARKTSVFVRYALALSLAAAPVTAAFAQSSPAPRPPQEQGQQAKGSLTVAVSGLVGPAGSTTPLTGTFKILRFARSDSGIAAVGTLTANVTDPATSTARTVVTQITLPVTLDQATAQAASDELDAPEHGPAVLAQAQACGILNLVLGPLDLDLLGLQVHLDQVVLDITAVPGAGNLLGNLLCAITGLLDNTSQLARLVALLNELLDILG